jgi:hypothetical protein
VNHSLKRRLVAWLGVSVVAVTLAAAAPASAQVDNGVRAPYLYKPAASGSTVTLRWVDDSSDEDWYQLYRRGADGHWVGIATVTTPSRENYGYEISYTDTVQGSGKGQCYMVTAVRAAGGYGQSDEKCSPMVNPPPGNAVNWYHENDQPEIYSGQNWGFWNRSAGSGFQYLRYQTREYGINLGWTPSSSIGDVAWMIKGQGLADGATIPNGHPVALRAAGSGKYLKYAVRTYGVNLDWSTSPAYEWELIRPDDNFEFALYNLVTNNYLVFKTQSYGVNLGWYYETPTPPPPPMPGTKSVTISSCFSENRPLQIWVLNLTAGGSWVNAGRIDPSWSGGSCNRGTTITYSPPVTGHIYRLRAVDNLRSDCVNGSPSQQYNSSCVIGLPPDFRGDTIGQAGYWQI